MSSEAMHSRNGSPQMFWLGSSARQRRASPGTSAIFGEIGSSVYSLVAKASTKVLNSKFSTLVCSRNPGEPPLRSPRRRVMVSPLRRKPRPTRMVMQLAHGRTPLRSTAYSRLAPLEAETVL